MYVKKDDSESIIIIVLTSYLSARVMRVGLGMRVDTTAGVVDMTGEDRPNLAAAVGVRQRGLARAERERGRMGKGDVPRGRVVRV